jgi:prophage antirepressor-like protein
MNEFKVFTYQSNKVRTVFINGEPWWVLKDICTVLGLSNPTIVAARIDTDEVTKFDLGGLSGESNIVNESGLYNVILRSDKPEAKEFKRWITHEVLPSIRKTGGYTAKKSRAPRSKPVDIIFRQRLNMARDFSRVTGVPLGIAVAKAIDDAEKLTGEDYTHWKRVLPARADEKPVPHLNATNLGHKQAAGIGRVSGQIRKAVATDRSGQKTWRGISVRLQWSQRLLYSLV